MSSLKRRFNVRFNIKMLKRWLLTFYRFNNHGQGVPSPNPPSFILEGWRAYATPVNCRRHFLAGLKCHYAWH
jgi:hypothetical protein